MPYSFKNAKATLINKRCDSYGPASHDNGRVINLLNNKNEGTFHRVGLKYLIGSCWKQKSRNEKGKQERASRTIETSDPVHQNAHSRSCFFFVIILNDFHRRNRCAIQKLQSIVPKKLFFLILCHLHGARKESHACPLCYEERKKNNMERKKINHKRFAFINLSWRHRYGGTTHGHDDSHG